MMSFAPPDVETSARVPDGEHGVEWGSAVHRLLEISMRSPEVDLEAIGSELLDEEDIDPGRLDDLVETVKAVRDSEVWKRAGAAGVRMPEVPFELLLGEADGAPLLVRGSIDLAFREDGGWVIVDYKTDTPPASGNMDELVEKYRPQLALYADAFHKCTGEEVAETALYFIRTGTLVTLG
jgi:ATP-dependent helicase/nuclease subunit A